MMDVKGIIEKGGSGLKRLEKALRKVDMDIYADLALLASAKLIASRIPRLKDVLSKHGHLVTIEELPQIYEKRARRVYVVFGKTCIEVAGAIFVEPEMLNGCEVVTIDRRRQTDITELCEVISASVSLEPAKEKVRKKSANYLAIKSLVERDEMMMSSAEIAAAAWDRSCEMMREQYGDKVICASPRYVDVAGFDFNPMEFFSLPLDDLPFPFEDELVFYTLPYFSPDCQVVIATKTIVALYMCGLNPVIKHIALESDAPGSDRSKIKKWTVEVGDESVCVVRDGIKTDFDWNIAMDFFSGKRYTIWAEYERGLWTLMFPEER